MATGSKGECKGTLTGGERSERGSRGPLPERFRPHPLDWNKMLSAIL